MKQLDFIGPGTVYTAYPILQPLASWATYKVALTESATGSKLFSGSVDESLGDYVVFAGSTQPASFNLRVATWNVPVVVEGTGAYTSTITVRQITVNTPLEGAKVRLTKGAESYQYTSNASGVVTAALDAGTWTVAITLAGYTFTPTTLAVSATGSTTYDMALASSMAPSEPGQTTGYWYVYDETGTPEPAAVVVMEAANPATGSTGIVLEDASRTATADAAGLVVFTNLFPGASYIAYRQGSTRKFTITVPTTGSSVALGSIVG